MTLSLYLSFALSLKVADANGRTTPFGFSSLDSVAAGLPSPTLLQSQPCFDDLRISRNLSRSRSLGQIISLSRCYHSQTQSPTVSSESPFPTAIMDGDALLRGDKLILRGLTFHGFHGVKPEERKLGQKFLVDVDAWMDLRAAGKSDLLSETVSYTSIYRIVKEIVEGPPHNLLESVAEQIATTTMTNHHQISAVRVKVGKPHVAVQGPVDYLGVEIFRERGNIPN